MTKRKQTPPNLAMRFSKADKDALRKLAAHMGTSQTEAVRRLVRERLQTYKPPKRRIT
ncbi:MAG: ribbon-helix-helix protein, CopG family [Chloroflexota bacterium]